MTRFQVEYTETGSDHPQRADLTELLGVRIRHFGGVLQHLAPGASLDRSDVRLILCRTASRLAYLSYVTRALLRRPLDHPRHRSRPYQQSNLPISSANRERFYANPIRSTSRPTANFSARFPRKSPLSQIPLRCCRLHNNFSLSWHFAPHPHRIFLDRLEPVTHFLTGACMGRAGLNRKTALATLTLTLAAEAPDLDVLSRLHGPAFGFAHHRGFTHSFLGVPLDAAVVVGFVYLIWRLRGRALKDANLPPRWGLLFLYACLAGLSHILLDFTNNYGVRPFWPFSEKWYSWDIVFIFEPIMFTCLLLGLITPSLFSLIDKEIGARQRGPRAAASPPARPDRRRAPLDAARL